MRFHISKKSKKSQARIGFLETAHGVIETPSLVPVATQAVIKTLTSEEVEQTNSQILISNTFWLHLRSGEKIIEKAGGLHKFMNWKRPLMTDSGGFQVFSLGFGKDFGNTKILARNYAETHAESRGKIMSKAKPYTVRLSLTHTIKEGSQPKKVKITQDGVYFNSPVDGVNLFLGPKESMKIQKSLGADIIFAFDECPPPQAEYEYHKSSLVKTNKWAKICLNEKNEKQALYGIIQGGKFKDLRQESAKFIGSMEFDGFGIGGEFGSDKSQMPKMLNWVMKELPEKKPRHLLGIGHLEDIEKIIKTGVDTFDCTVPTHYARRGIAFTSEGRLDMNKAKFLKKFEPLDKNCTCEVCMNYTKAYIYHLLRAKEITPLKMITFHNLHYFNGFVEEVKTKIKRGDI